MDKDIDRQIEIIREKIQTILDEFADKHGLLIELDTELFFEVGLRSPLDSIVSIRCVRLRGSHGN